MGQKNIVFFTKKKTKICVTSVKTAKGTTTYPTNLCLKLEAETPSGYGETSFTKFSLKMKKERKTEERKNSTENISFPFLKRGRQLKGDMFRFGPWTFLEAQAKTIYTSR